MTRRPPGITALSIFFIAGALISFTAAASLFFPGSFLEPMWRLNPRAQEAFVHMGRWSPLLLLAASAGCAFSSVGLWGCKRWGHRLATAMIATNLCGDIANALSGAEPRAAIGIPIAGLILVFLLSRKIRNVFA